MTRLLLDRGANKDALTKVRARCRGSVRGVVCGAALRPCGGAQDGCTPLLRAAQNGQLEVVRLLLERGADKEAKDKVRRQSAAEFLPLPASREATVAARQTYD